MEFETTTSKEVIQSVTKMGERLKELKKKMEDAAEKAEASKKEYDYYASSILPIEMKNAGVTSIELVTGGKLSIDTKCYCSPNKNEKDRSTILKWLNSVNGEHLIKSEAKVSTDSLDKLKEAHIPFAEVSTINTNSLKAFIMDKLGMKGGVKSLEVEDIPNCVHFYEVQTAKIED